VKFSALDVHGSVIPILFAATSRIPRFATMTAVAALMILQHPVYAGPTGGTVVAGSAGIQQSGNTTNINQSSAKAIINWQGFSISSQETVNFNQPGSSSVTLNRVIGNETSVINGALNANGQVFIVNSAGVLFGKGAQVNVGGLVASTLDISNENFMAGKYSFSGSSTASVVNRGNIHAAPGGYVSLLGKTVANDGVITANLGTVALASGSQITLNFGGNSLVDVTIDKGVLNALVSNKRAIIANGGQVIMTAKAADEVLSAQVNNSGIIQARTMAALTGGSGAQVTKKGSIKLLADGGTVNVSGKLDASAPKGGDGGFIETSGNKVKVADATIVTTKAANGKTGTWLIDPDGFTIAATGGDITGAQLSSELASNNITITSTSGSGSDGNVNVNDAVSWSAHTLTLEATNNTVVNAVMSATGTASFVGTYGTGANPDGSPKGLYMGLNANGTFAGRLDFNSTGSLSLGGNTYTVFNTLSALVSAANTTPGGFYALGSNLDPTTDTGSTYTFSGPAITNLTGALNGLGHTITGLNINDTAGNGGDALVGTLGSNANAASSISNIGLVNATVSDVVWAAANIGSLVATNWGAIGNSYASNVSITAINRNDSFGVGGLVGLSNSTGIITGSYATGIVAAPSTTFNAVNFGGLVGNNAGTIRNSHAGVAHAAGTPSILMVNIPSTVDFGLAKGTAGGLVGINSGTIDLSYADGGVSLTNGNGAGGLVGSNSGTIINSHATGDVTVTENIASSTTGWNDVGGLAGSNTGSISNSYATGNVLLLGNQRIDNIGGLVGNNGGSISNSSASGSSVAGALGSNIGGLVGFNDGSISNSSASAAVTGFDDVGGLAGTNSGGTITGSHASGSVKSTDPNGSIGGLVGQNLSPTIQATGVTIVGTISNSSASGTVTGAAGANIGGLVGYNNFGSIANSTASGNVFVTGTVANANGAAGGLVGSNFGGTITGSSASGDVSGVGVLGALAGYNTGTIDGSTATGELNGQTGTLVGSNTFTSPFTHITTKGTVTNSTYHDAKAEAAAAARAAAEAAAEAAAARQAAIQQASSAANVIGTTDTQVSALTPPTPGLSAAGTKAVAGTSSGSVADSIKTIEDAIRVEERREHRGVAVAARTRSNSNANKGGNFGASIRTIDVNGHRFNLENGAPKENTPGQPHP
jgi:filamentous hemagglutinin family protein